MHNKIGATNVNEFVKRKPKLKGVWNTKYHEAHFDPDCCFRADLMTIAIMISLKTQGVIMFPVMLNHDCKKKVLLGKSNKSGSCLNVDSSAI